MNKNINYTHGGDLDRAAKEYGIPREHWLDLSTGIAPWSWPVPDIPQTIWQRLPSVECPLVGPAAEYYGCNPSAVLATPGSQFAIQSLPALFSSRRVALPVLGYFEHRKAWQAAGHQLVDYTDNSLDQLDAQIKSGEIDLVLVINPNNPTAATVEKEQLLIWSDLLAQRGGYLVIDEAFMDVDSTSSLAPYCPRPGLVVLRSLGKFFGLAGLRLGFVLAEATLRERLSKLLGPWAVNGPAQYLGARALADRVWQQVQRQRVQQALSAQTEMLQSVFSGLNGHEAIKRESVNQGYEHLAYGKLVSGPLFISVFLKETVAIALSEQLGMRGIFVRRFFVPYGAVFVQHGSIFVQHRPTIGSQEQHGCLRFGLAKDNDQLLRLQKALKECVPLV